MVLPHNAAPSQCCSLTRALSQVDASAGGEYGELLVHLTADYDPGRLMEVLAGSQAYPLEVALEVAAARGMVDEQVRWRPPPLLACALAGRVLLACLCMAAPPAREGSCAPCSMQSSVLTSRRPAARAAAAARCMC